MKKVGIVSYYPAIDPPGAPSEERLGTIARALAGAFRVTLVTPDASTARQQTLESAPNLTEHRFPKTAEYQKWHDRFEAEAGFGNCSGLVCALAAEGHGPLREAVEAVARESDILLLDGPWHWDLVRRHRRKKQLLVYSSVTAEGHAAEQLYPGKGWGARARKLARRLEGGLVREADLVLAQYGGDIAHFQQLYEASPSKIVFVPNGMDIDAFPPRRSEAEKAAARRRFNIPRERLVVVYNGWNLPDNEKAVDLIIQHLAVEVPFADFLIMGHICAPYQGREMPGNVRLMGWLNELERREMLHAADAAVLPMLRPRQNWTEFLEFLSAGLPIVCTPQAAEGMQLEHRRHVMVRRREELAEGLSEVLAGGIPVELLSREARRIVEERHSWKFIGEMLRNMLRLKAGPRLLILNDYVVCPAEQGGQVRIDSVARNLAEEGIASTILTLKAGGPEERRQVAPLIEEINVPRSTLHTLADKVIGQKLRCGAQDVTALKLTHLLSRDYIRTMKREMRLADGVMLSHPYMQAALGKPPADIPLYYDSHNTEFRLKEAIYPHSRLSRFLINSVRRAEIAAARNSAATFCVSDGNRMELMEMVPELAGKSFVCPNGVEVGLSQLLSFDERRRKRREAGINPEVMAIFVGSGHPPNAEAARFIINELSRYHARVLFVLVGTVNGWFWNDPQPINVLFTGPVSTGVKNMLLSLSDVALNPMLTGSGTSLKMMDYMAAGLPILSTSVGARGLSEKELEAVMVLDPPEFNRALHDLISDRAKMEAYSAAGRRLAEERYDWKITLRTMTERISRDLGGGAPPPQNASDPITGQTRSPHAAV